MKDQKSIDGNESQSDRFEGALALFTESILKPDDAIRSCAHNQHCYNELMEIKNHMLDYLQTYKRFRTVANINNDAILEYMRENIPSRY